MADLRTVLRIIARDETKGQLSKVTSELRGVSSTIATIRNQALALAGVNFGLGGFAQLIALADGYQLTTSRLELLSGETEKFADIQRSVFDIAQDTFTTYEQTSQIYGNLAASTREVGLRSEQLLTITKALNQSYQISGSTQQEAAASTLQLTQALASGQIRGQEFNSVAEQGRRILFALKDATGLTAGELRNFANNGKLTTEFFVNAFLPQAQKINDEFDRLPLTVGRSLTQLNNAFQQYVGEQNKSLGATRDIAEVIQGVARDFDSFANSLVALAGTALAFYTQRFVASLSLTTAAKIKNAQASLTAIRAEQANLAAKLKTAKVEQGIAVAQQARIAGYVREQQAILASARSFGAYTAAQEAALVNLRRLAVESNVAANAVVAANAKVAAASTATAAATTRAALATRLWAGTIAFLGGPIGAAITGLLALGAAFVYLRDSTPTGEDDLRGFREGINKISEDAERASTSLDGVADAMTRVKLASEFEQLAQGERALKKLAAELAKLESDFFEATGGAAREDDVRLRYIEKKKVAYNEAKKEVEEYRGELKGLIDDEKALARELTGRDASVTGVPKKLKDAIDEQNTANSQLKKIETERRKLIDQLDKLSDQLSGPDLGNIEDQTASFNIASLNTLRNQITSNVDAGDAESALDNLERAKTIVEQLQKTGGASDSFLKTQVDLLKQLGEDIGDIGVNEEDVTIPVKVKADENALLEEGRNLAKVYNETIAPNFPFLAPVKFDPETASKAIATWRQQEQEKLNNAPLVATVVAATSADAAATPATPGYAGGGRIRGPGTGTSDSIMAWLSNDEFVIRERAAKHYGYSFLNALNNLRLPKFASGGRVGGGGGSSGAPIIFNLDGQRISANVTGPEVDTLRQALKRENMKRGLRV
jgi:tape measure domain-containing protein